MDNPITKSPVKLLSQVAKAIPGVTTFTVVLGLPVGMTATMTAQETALQTAQNMFLEKVTELKTSQAAKRAAFKAAQRLIALIRQMAKPALGGKFTQEWAAFGFGGSLRAPTTMNGMITFLGTLAGHLTTHPEFGSTEQFADAAQVTALRATLMAAVNAVNVKKSEVRQKFEDRVLKVAAVRLSLREVLSALRLKFSPLDGRWSEFGFNRPGVLSVPAVPQGVTVVQAAANSLMVKWPAAARAEFYRVWLKIIGQDTEMLTVKTTTDLDALLEALPGNAQLEVAVSAINNGGESAKSAVVPVVTQ